MKYDFDEIIDRSDISVKYCTPTLLHPGCTVPKEYIPMWIADMDFKCCEKILYAIKTRIDRGTLGYEAPANFRYRNAICNWYQKRYNWKFDTESIITCNGAIDGLRLAVLALTKPNQGIIIQRPVYGPFSITIENNNRRIINNALIYDNGNYFINFEDLEKKASDPETVMLAFCNPHNPAARVWTENELKKVYDICDRHNVIIVSDEVHGDITRKEYTYTPMGKISRKNVITNISMGKTFGLTGLHLANMIIEDEKIRQKILNTRGRSNPSPLAATASIAAYEECEEWVNQINTYLDESFKIVAEALPTVLPKAKLIQPEGSFLAWINMSAYNLTQEQLSHYFVEIAGVIPDPGTHFGPEGDGFIRLNIACPHSILKKALDNIKNSFKML